MDWKAIAGALSGLGLMFAVVPYIVAIVRKTARPSVVSWGGVGAISAISFAAQMSAEPSWSAVLSGAACVYCPLIVVAAWRTGSRHITRIDVVCLVVGAVAIVAWQSTGTPVLALALAALADLVLCLPMIQRVAVDPTTEPLAPFAIAVLASGLGIAAARRYDAVSLVWPVYLCALNGVIALFAARPPRGRERPRVTAGDPIARADVAQGIGLRTGHR